MTSEQSERAIVLIAQMCNLCWNLGQGCEFGDRERAICRELAAEYDRLAAMVRVAIRAAEGGRP